MPIRSDAQRLKRESREFPSWDLRPRQLCDLELLLMEGFSPLRGFMTRPTTSVFAMRWPYERCSLANPHHSGCDRRFGEIAYACKEQDRLARCRRSNAGAVCMWKKFGNRIGREEAQAVFNTTSLGHPGVDHLLNKANPWYVGGRLEECRRLPVMISKTLALSPVNCVSSSPGKAGAASSRSRRATRCIAPQCRINLPRRQTSRSKFAGSSGSGPNQAGRR